VIALAGVEAHVLSPAVVEIREGTGVAGGGESSGELDQFVADAHRVHEQQHVHPRRPVLRARHDRCHRAVGRLDLGALQYTIIVAGNAVCQPLVDELLAAERMGDDHDLTSLRSIISSGMAMSDRLKNVLRDHAKVTIIDAIASSEGGPFAFAITSSTDDLPARFFPAASTKVLTPDDTEVVPGSGEVGVLAYSGPMPLGYCKLMR
jgi:hypothetical protein